MKEKKYLNFKALKNLISDVARSWEDPRRAESKKYSAHDAVLGGFACMYFQEPSLLQFQQRMQDELNNNNFRTLFGIEDIPKTNALKDILDAFDPDQFNPVFQSIVQRLDRGKHLDQFKLTGNLTLCSIDGTQYYSSQSVRCKGCLTKNKDNPDKSTTYQHAALQAALMHPDLKQVVPVLAKNINNTDGTKKQDCELNAAKRLIPTLRKLYPKKSLVITGDDLFSKQVLIELIHEHRFNYIFVAKPGSHKCMMKWLSTNSQLSERRERDKKGNLILYQWQNKVPLRGGKDAVEVNYFCKKKYKVDHDGNETLISTESWVTDLTVTANNVMLLTRGAKARWKIENECFNNLKNQGYNLEHNYGHGENHLSFNFYLLTMLAFTFHQVFELTDPNFIACRKKAGSKINLWGQLRALINLFIFQSWQQLIGFFFDKDRYFNPMTNSYDFNSLGQSP